MVIERDSRASMVEGTYMLKKPECKVDFFDMVKDEFLERFGLEKETMKVVNLEGRGRILWAMNGCNYKVVVGGSLSNSLMTLARLSDISIGGHALNVAMAGSVGSDSLNGFYRVVLYQRNVNFHSEFIKDGTNKTKRVLTTLDARRTMLVYQGTSASNYDSGLVGTASKINIIVDEDPKNVLREEEGSVLR
ncbi:hypothetical protein GQ457_05G028630 [Hibiscus cannabinus]